MLNTMKPLSLKGNGILGKKLTYVTGDTQTKSDAARASARRMIEKDGVIMFTGGSSSGVAVACQALGQELGIIYMCGLTHSNDTRSEEHTSELQSLMRISYAVFCLKKKKTKTRLQANKQ